MFSMRNNKSNYTFMSKNFYNSIAGFIFLSLALVHIVRIAMGWDLIIGDWHAPFALSLVAAIIGLLLGYIGLRPGRR